VGLPSAQKKNLHDLVTPLIVPVPQNYIYPLLSNMTGPHTIAELTAAYALVRMRQGHVRAENATLSGKRKRPTSLGATAALGL